MVQYREERNVRRHEARRRRNRVRVAPGFGGAECGDDREAVEPSQRRDTIRRAEHVAALRRLYGFSVITALCAAEISAYADGITAAPHLVSTHLTLLAILYHLHLLRMYVRRWARTRTL